MEMKLYGLYDSRTGNFGDICILRCDAEFVDGMTKRLIDSDLPDYYLSDIRGVCYGDIASRNCDTPIIIPYDEPIVLFYGRDICDLRKHNVDKEEKANG